MLFSACLIVVSHFTSLKMAHFFCNLQTSKHFWATKKLFFLIIVIIIGNTKRQRQFFSFNIHCACNLTIFSTFDRFIRAPSHNLNLFTLLNCWTLYASRITLYNFCQICGKQEHTSKTRVYIDSVCFIFRWFSLRSPIDFNHSCTLYCEWKANK